MSGVLIIAEQRRGELRAPSLELVTAAQALREGGAVSVAVIADQPGSFVPA
jgi:electron transfer flavoprotein alpha subunit